MIITIDKSKELTRKEYVDFLHKTKGETLSEARISQMVSAGKLKVRDYPELNNLQLVVLDDDEQALARARFSTSQALHTYSYKDLGLMFGKLIHDLTNENGNARTLLSEKQAQMEALTDALHRAEAEREEARKSVQRLTQENAELAADNQALQAELDDALSGTEALQAENYQLAQQLADSQRKLDIEASTNRMFNDFKTMVLELLQNQRMTPGEQPLMGEGVDSPAKRKKRTGE
jgi:regulator of replication initiation timing